MLKRWNFLKTGFYEGIKLDIFWLRDESMEDSANLPPPDQIADEIVEDLRSALDQLEEIAADLSPEVVTRDGLVG